VLLLTEIWYRLISDNARGMCSSPWRTVKSPGHAPGVLPRLLADLAADVVIAGGMGPKAIDLFCGHGITVLLGVEGSVEDAVRRYLRGELEEGTNVCHH
jgi:predicted Fe-Mo cluster-binding NifX family protein